MSVVLAYGTEKQAYFDLFMESCRRFGIEPVILGWGERWEGTCKKLETIRNYLNTMPATEIVLSVDPFDVVFLAGLEEIESRFESQDAPFLCGALRLSSFNASIYEHEFNRTQLKTPENPGAYNFLNAGTWISTAGYARELLETLAVSGQLQKCDMDQEVFTGLYLKDRSVIDIDWKCGIFQNILFRDFISRRPDLRDLEFSGDRIINHATGSRPSLLHASGNAIMKGISRSLAYSPHVSLPKKDLKNYSRKAIFHLGKILSHAFRQISSGVRTCPCYFWARLRSCS